MWVICSWFVFFICCWQCFPFLCSRGNRSRGSSLIRSLIKSDLSDSLPRHSLKMSDCERFAHVALSLTKNERFARKTDEQIPNPGLSGLVLLCKNFGPSVYFIHPPHYCRFIYKKEFFWLLWICKDWTMNSNFSKKGDSVLSVSYRPGQRWQ